MKKFVVYSSHPDWEGICHEKAKVYFTSLRTGVNQSLTDKLRLLMKRAGMTDMPLDGKMTAIKMHFGEDRKSVV